MAFLRFARVATRRITTHSVGADRIFIQLTRTFTSWLSRARSPASPPNITTVSTECYTDLRSTHGDEKLSAMPPRESGSPIRSLDSRFRG